MTQTSERAAWKSRQIDLAGGPHVSVADAALLSSLPPMGSLKEALAVETLRCEVLGWKLRRESGEDSLGAAMVQATLDSAARAREDLDLSATIRSLVDLVGCR